MPREVRLHTRPAVPKEPGIQAREVLLKRCGWNTICLRKRRIYPPERPWPPSPQPRAEPPVLWPGQYLSSLGASCGMWGEPQRTKHRKDGHEVLDLPWATFNSGAPTSELDKLFTFSLPSLRLMDCWMSKSRLKEGSSLALSLLTSNHIKEAVTQVSALCICQGVEPPKGILPTQTWLHCLFRMRRECWLPQGSCGHYLCKILRREQCLA